MQLPIKAHYASLAMLALAEKFASQEPLSARAIAGDQHIPNQFLTQILQQLRATGLVTSTRGANGGFLLSKAPKHISLADILDSVCPASNSLGDDTGQSSMASVLHATWEQLEKQEKQALQSIRLSDLLEKVHANADMFYI